MPQNKEKKENFDFNTRSYTVNSSSINVENKTVDAVLATENPVTIYDWNRGDYVEEILLVDGMEYSEQIPLLDSHNRQSVKDQLGSIRNIKKNKDALAGTLHFGNTPDAEAAFSLAEDRHLTDVSIGYRTIDSVYVTKGQSADINGRNFKASDNIDLKVSTRTIVKEGSITPIGADEMAKIRKAVEFNHECANCRKLESENKEIKSELELTRKALRLTTN